MYHDREFPFTANKASSPAQGLPIWITTREQMMRDAPEPITADKHDHTFLGLLLH